MLELRSSSERNGLMRKSNAPSRMAFTTVIMSPDCRDSNDGVRLHFVSVAEIAAETLLAHPANPAALVQ
jgi:hypothetical protein